MPKIKTHKAMSKRIKRTGSGKIKRRSAFISHLLSKRSSARKRRHKGQKTLSRADLAEVKKLVPYRKI